MQSCPADILQIGCFFCARNRIYNARRCENIIVGTAEREESQKSKTKKKTWIWVVDMNIQEWWATKEWYISQRVYILARRRHISHIEISMSHHVTPRRTEFWKNNFFPTFQYRGGTANKGVENLTRTGVLESQCTLYIDSNSYNSVFADGGSDSAVSEAGSVVLSPACSSSFVFSSSSFCASRFFTVAGLGLSGSSSSESWMHSKWHVSRLKYFSQRFGVIRCTKIESGEQFFANVLLSIG